MPAIKLASIMRQSTATYRFVFRVCPEQVCGRATSFATARRRYKADLEDMDVLDVGSNIMLKKGRDYEEEAKDGSIAESTSGGAHGASSRRDRMDFSFLLICSSRHSGGAKQEI